MAGGYDGLHDMTAIIFGSTLVSNTSKAHIDSEFTRQVKRDLIIAKDEASNRGLLQSYNWCADLAMCVSRVPLPDEPPLPHYRHQLGDEAEAFDRAKGLFNLKDYFRAAYFSEPLKKPLCRFLHLYSRYCAYEQKINNDRLDSITLLPKNVPGPHLHEIANCLGPAYHRVTRKEDYPATTKGILGIGDYEYKTKLTKRNNIQTAGSKSPTSTTGATTATTTSTTTSTSSNSGAGVAAPQQQQHRNGVGRALGRKLRSRINRQLQDEDIELEDDLEDLDVAHLGDDIDGIDIDDDAEVDDGFHFRLAGQDEDDRADIKLSEEDIACGYDSYLMYLYGVVLKQLGHRRQAIEVLCWAIHLRPLNWAAWAELAELIVKRSTLERMDLPDVWQRRVFLCQVFVELNLDADCLAACEQLAQQGLHGSTYLRTHRALALRNLRELDLAIGEFESIEKSDPFRVESVDIYSNMLYVQERRVQLANLAAKMVQVAKYSVETCCVVGNYLGLRGEHEKAVVYFQRALKLNPRFVSAYTLMGYEYMEMKNTIQAIQCYRNALKINRRDYRAWFGLGQTYELLRLLNYSLFYLKQAQRLHPYDSRMMTALGEAFERKEMFLEAKKCYVKAHSVGDMEDTALLKLAKLYERLGECERAADAFERYLQETGGEECDDQEERGRAHHYLAEFMLRHNQFDRAEEHAKRCIACAETQEAGKSLLKEITHRRNLADALPAMPLKDEARTLLPGNRARSSDDDPPRLPPPSLRPFLHSP